MRSQLSPFLVLPLLPLSTAWTLPSFKSEVSPPQLPFLASETLSKCDCTGTKPNASDTGPASICDDWRLGTESLPTKFPLLSLVADYDRFGDLTPGAFIAKWWNYTANNWKWPPEDGFFLDAKQRPINGTMTLPPGTKVDRFGDEGGRFIAAADAAFDQRALPPSALRCSRNASYPYYYYVYTVLKDLTVSGGPVAPWFGQPGLGTQFNIAVSRRVNISTLVKEGYLRRENLSDITWGAGKGGKCGL